MVRLDDRVSVRKQSLKDKNSICLTECMVDLADSLFERVKI